MNKQAPLSDSESLALSTLWRKDGFVDSSSEAFMRRSRHYQWRVNLCFAVGFAIVGMCWFAPDWLAQQVNVKTPARDWFDQYVMVRSIMAACWLAAGLYAWRTRRNMLNFWIAFTVFALGMWGVDRWLATTPMLSSEPSLTGALWPLRLTLVFFGALNIWRHAFAPLPTQRHLFSWRLRRQT